ncbi:MAG TPA: ABC transporter ATP-binding protein [Dehalococcoidia bacterium]|nr:ABC transporter ATP-binding protein [Dehalococcoidia bacterium]
MKRSTPPDLPALTPDAAAPPAVEISDLRYHYGERAALDGLTLRVPPGSIFGLLGPNGSGKSTLLGVLIGRRLAASGQVRVLGEPLSAGLRRRMAMVFQEPSLDPTMTVRETMRLQARLFGRPQGEAARETEALLARVGLGDRAGAMTATLSGGMKRRLELARALLTAPDLILLDEPTLALDPDSRQRLWQHLLEANADGRTLLLATNDVHEAERYCHTVALLDEGRLVAQGTPAELKRDLRRDAVRIAWKHDPVAEIAIMQTWRDVGHVRVAGRTTHVTVDAASPFLTRIFQQSGDLIHGVEIEESTLEDVYFQLVGKAITPRADGAGGEEP